MQTHSLTLSEARRFLLAHHSLWPPYSLAGKAGVLEYIRRVGCIQFDPLDIVGQNPALVLQARVADFRPQLLQDLLYEDRRLLDGWDKNMSIYAVEDWPYFRRRREAAQHSLGAAERPAAAIREQVRQALEQRGPLSSLDLDFDQTVDWWWAPTRLARAALESMYTWGELIIHHKVHTRKVYDLAERHLPDALRDAPDPNPSTEAYHDWYVLRRMSGLGLLRNQSGDAWLGIAGLKSQERSAALERLLTAEKISVVQVAGLKLPLYLRRADLPLLEAVRTTSAPLPPLAAILAPLDNLLWDRRLVEDVFGFAYRWEVYKPVGERKYGYYVLPVLYGDRFVARFEPGRAKPDGALVIKQWWWEEDVALTTELRSALETAARRFMAYLGAPRLQVEPAAAAAGVEWLATIS